LLADGGVVLFGECGDVVALVLGLGLVAPSVDVDDDVGGLV
jgi:hypothetical protein